MTSVTQKLSEFEALKAQKDAAKQAAKKPAATPTANVKLVYQHPAIEEEVETTLELRILTFDECMRRDTLAGVLANANWDLLPPEAQTRCLAIATAQVMWPKAPEWFTWLLEYDTRAVVELYRAVEAHRDAYFRRDAGEGEGAAPAPRLVITPLGAPKPTA